MLRRRECQVCHLVHECEMHKPRGLLMNYGVQHNYPTVRFGRFAIGNAPDVWKVPVLLGSDEMIAEAVTELALTGEEVA